MSLLDKARAKRRVSRGWSKGRKHGEAELLELALALVRGDISTCDASHAMGQGGNGNSGTNGSLFLRLRRAVAAGEVRITVVKPAGSGSDSGSDLVGSGQGIVPLTGGRP